MAPSLGEYQPPYPLFSMAASGDNFGEISGLIPTSSGSTIARHPPIYEHSLDLRKDGDIGGEMGSQVEGIAGMTGLWALGILSLLLLLLFLLLLLLLLLGLLGHSLSWGV